MQIMTGGGSCQKYRFSLGFDGHIMTYAIMQWEVLAERQIPGHQTIFEENNATMYTKEINKCSDA